MPFQRIPLPHPHSHRSSSAFTLIELLAVIAIMVLLLTLTVPLMRGGTSMAKSSWDMAGVIDQARAYAMAQNTYVWVCFNEDQAVVPANQTNTAVFVLASQDGSPTFDRTNLSQIGKTAIFENLSLFSSGSSSFGNRATTQVTQLAAISPVSMPAATLPVGKLSTYTSNRVLRIDPEGSVRIPTAASLSSMTMVPWLELGLQPLRGAVKGTDDIAAIQIAGLTGQTHVYRP